MRPNEVRQTLPDLFYIRPTGLFQFARVPPHLVDGRRDQGDLDDEKTNELQTINTAWQIAIQEILRMIVRDIYRTGGEAAFKSHIKRIEEAAVDSIYTGLMLRGTDEWTETLVKEKASNFVTTLLTSFTFDRA